MTPMPIPQRTAALPVLLLLAAIAPAAAGTVKVTATNIRSDQGSIIVWVYDNADNWLSDRWRTQKTITVSGNRTGDSVTLELTLPAGEYALSVFQDLDNDGKLGRNFIGLPKEPAGLSNNARPRFGPPRYKDARFAVGDASVEQRIRLE
jgi:uncharacterized protein (DUF2141 family)